MHFSFTLNRFFLFVVDVLFINFIIKLTEFINFICSMTVILDYFLHFLNIYIVLNFFSKKKSPTMIDHLFS